MLLKLMLDGAFLVRAGERVQNSFAITFMADKKVKHCLIKKEGRLFLIGTAQFESLVDLVAHYEKNPLYKKVKLKTPVTEELLARRGNMSPGGAGEGGEGGEGYMDPALFTSKTCARALYEYKARRDDELSFPAGALINNVSPVQSSPVQSSPVQCFTNSGVPGQHTEAGRGLVAGRLRWSEVPLVPGQLHQTGGESGHSGCGGQQRQSGVQWRQSQERSVWSLCLTVLRPSNQ